MKELCFCCASHSMIPLEDYKEFQHYKCEKCGYENYNSQKTHISSELYEDDPDYENELTSSLDHKLLLQWNHSKALKFLKKHIPIGSTTLDIGCFNGFFVKELVDLNYDAFGIDFNKNAIKHGVEHYGLSSRLSSETIMEQIQLNKKFDVITLFEVIEHVEGNPTNFLIEISKLLKPNGVLILSTPNSKMVWRPAGDYPPQHLSRFTPRALKTCVDNASLKQIYKYEQMSAFDLIRNLAGTYLFRSKRQNSLKGGELKYKNLSNALRFFANKIRWIAYLFFSPADKLLHFFGMRYMCQISISKKL